MMKMIRKFVWDIVCGIMIIPILMVVGGFAGIAILIGGTE